MAFNLGMDKYYNDKYNMSSNFGISNDLGIKDNKKNPLNKAFSALGVGLMDLAIDNNASDSVKSLYSVAKKLAYLFM